MLGCILLCVAAVRFRLCEMPLERDEGEFAYGGQLLLQGILPGQDLYTLKLPGTHTAYAMMMSVFGQSSAGVHLGLLMVNCATIVFLFLLSRALLGNLAAVVASATYGLISLSADALGTSAHATHFVVLSVLAGLWLLWQAMNTGRRIAYLGAGFLLGSSVLMKHNGLPFVAFGALWLLWSGRSKTSATAPPFWKAMLCFGAGLAAPMVLLLLVLWQAGTLENCWFWSVTYARAYAKPNPGVTLVWLNLMQRMPAVLQLPFYAGLAGLAVLWMRREGRSAAIFSTGLLVFSLLAVVPGLHLRPHYYVLLMPALAFLVGALVQQTTGLLDRWRVKFLTAIPLILFAICCTGGIAREWNFFCKMTPVEACRSLYGFQPFPEAIALADYIREHSTPDARVAVLGSEPEIYFYSRRRSATGYIYTYPLTEKQPFAERMREQMRQEIDTTQPKFVVQARSWTSWLNRPGGQKRIDELCEFLMPPGYQLIAACEFLPAESRVVWHWPPDAIPSPTNSATELLLFERITITPASGTSD